MTIHLMYEPSAATTLEEAAKYAQEIAGNHAGAIYFHFRDTLVRVEPTDEPDEIHQHWINERRKQVNVERDETGQTLEDYKRKFGEVLDANKALSESYVRIREMVGAMDYKYPDPPAARDALNTPAGQAGMWAYTEQKVANVVAERDHLAEAHKILAANSGALSRAYLRLRNIIGNMHNSPHGSEGAEAMYAFTEEELSRKLNELRDERDSARRGQARARGALQLVMNRLSEALNMTQIDIEYRGTPAFQADMLARLNMLAGQRDDLRTKCDELQHDVDGLMRTPFPTSLHAEIILQKVVDALAEANHEDNFKITSWAPGMLEDWALRAIQSLKNESGLVTTNWTFTPDILQETYDALASQLEIPTVRVTTVPPGIMKSRLLKGIADLAQQRYDARIALLNMQGQRDAERATNKELVQEHSHRASAIQSIRSQVDRTDAKGDTLEWRTAALVEEYLRMQKLLQNSPHVEGALLTMQAQRDEAIQRLEDWETNNLKGWIEVLPKGQRDAIYDIMERVGGLFGLSYWEKFVVAEPRGLYTEQWTNFRQHLMYLYSTWRVACDQLGYTFPDSSPREGTDAR